MERTMAKWETGKRLRKLREALGYTQEEMAELLEVSVTLYKKMENGNYNISVRTMRRLKKVTGVSIDHLMFGDRKSFDEIWMLLQSSDNAVKMKLLLRLIVYFGIDSRECCVERKCEEKYSVILDDWVTDIFEKSEKI